MTQIALPSYLDQSEAVRERFDKLKQREVILEELGSFSEELLAKPMIVAGTKIDACQDESRRDALRRKLPE